MTACCMAQSGSGPGRDADLAVDVLDVVVGGLGRDGSRSAISRVVSPRAASRRTSTSRRVSPPGCRCRLPDGARGSPCPAATSTARLARGSSTPCDSSWRSSAAAYRGREGQTVGSLGGHPHVDLGRGEDADPRSSASACNALVIPGPVALLVVRRCDRVQDGQRRRAAQHLLGQHRVKFDPIELRPRQRPGLVQDRVRHDGGAEVVHERGAPDRGDGLFGQSEHAGGVGRELRAATAVPAHVRRLQVDEVCGDGQCVVELLPDSMRCGSGSSASTASHGSISPS